MTKTQKQEEKATTLFPRKVIELKGTPYVIEEWNTLQIEEAAPYIEELFELYNQYGSKLNKENWKEAVPALVRKAPKPINELIVITLNNEENGIVTREVLKKVKLVDAIQITMAVIEFNFLNPELLSQVVEVINSAVESINQVKK